MYLQHYSELSHDYVPPHEKSNSLPSTTKKYTFANLCYS